ncbi:WD repeat-containing protein 44 [Acropora cervicornis]|uniref:WD repeat-containing protein 44 n=1 Tax=Acropora cervicornis TaxID=6130 RepID=A0AAD9R5B9_ACRCE|nr:WD repeat-containing protein 44 [Acropora cervicornis]
MQSESDSDNEFFDAPEKLSFVEDSSDPKDFATVPKNISNLTDNQKSEDPLCKDVGQCEINSTGIKSNHNRTTISQDRGDLQATQKPGDTDNSREPDDSNLGACAEFTSMHSDMISTSPSLFNRIDSNGGQVVPGSHLTDQCRSVGCSEKKGDISGPEFCTNASQIIAGVVESIEQESTIPPVAPPRRKRKNKKSASDSQHNNASLSPTSESPGPDSAAATPTEHKQRSIADDFAKATFGNSVVNELEAELACKSSDDDPSIQVDANNKEMKNVLDKASSTEVISALNLDTRLKSGSVASLGSSKSDSYASVASSISNGTYEKSGSFTSVASTHSFQHQASHHGLVRYQSVSGRPLSDIEILEQVMVKNLDTGEAVPLSVAEEKLPKCTNPLALQIMRLTSEFHSNPDLSNLDNEDGLERKVSKKTSSSDEESPQDNAAPLIKGAVWTIKFTLCGRLMATAGQDHMVRVWVLKESQGYFEDMRAKYSKSSGNSSPNQEENQEDAEMEQTLRSGEEETVDLGEGKSSKEENEEPQAEPSVEEDLGPYMKTPLCTYCGHTGDVLDLSWSKNYFLLSSSMDKTVRLWHISRSECLCCFQHIDFVTAICFHPRDDRYFLSGSLDGKIRLWNIPDKKVALWNEVEGTGSNLITAANFCLNGKFAVVGTYDGRCIFYETEVRALRNKKARGRKISGIEPMPGEDKDNSLYCKYKGSVNGSSQIKASFSHDGQYVISGSEDHFVYIWRTQHGFPSSRRDKNEFYLSFSAHAVVVTAAMFAPVPWLIIPPDSSCQPFTTEVLVTADWSGAIKLFVNR